MFQQHSVTRETDEFQLVIDSECLLIDPQRPFVSWDRLIALSLMSIRYAEVVDRACRVDVIHSECLLIDLYRPFVLWDRLVTLPIAMDKCAKGA